MEWKCFFFPNSARLNHHWSSSRRVHAESNQFTRCTYDYPYSLPLVCAAWTFATTESCSSTATAVHSITQYIMWTGSRNTHNQSTTDICTTTAEDTCIVRSMHARYGVALRQSLICGRNYKHSQWLCRYIYEELFQTAACRTKSD